MADKFGRVYELQVDTNDDDSILIGGDREKMLTMDFSVKRTTMANANSAHITIWNLSEKNRNRLFKDQFDTRYSRKVKLCAGYDDGKYRFLPVIFYGEIRTCFSERQGPDFKTVLECFDCGIQMAVGKTTKCFAAGTQVKDIVRDIIKDIPDIKNVTLGDIFTQVVARGYAAIGNPAELAKELSGDRFFIDKGQAFVLNDDEVIQGELTEINADSGVLGSPRRGDQTITVDMIFEPRITCGQLVNYSSSTSPIFNGQYKVTGLDHRGIISSASCGDAITTITMNSNKVFKFVDVAPGFTP